MRYLLSLLLTAVTALPALAAPDTDLVNAARAQIGVTLKHDTRYHRIAFPGGDVPDIGGLAGDVVIRAYRKLGVDLQQLVIDDMEQAAAAYPKRRRRGGIDRNLDHRRVPNLAAWFARHGTVLPLSKEKTDFLPGDIVTYRLPGGEAHIAIISDRKSTTQVPLLLHNLRAGAREDNALFAFPMSGHYRWFPAPK